MQAHRGTVLVVEDDPILSELMTMALQDMGFEAHAADPPALLPIAMAMQPDVVILDLHMATPGEQLYRELHAEPTTAGIPVLISSAVRGALSQAAAMHTEGCLAKPFSLEALEGEVAKLVELRHARLSGCSGENQA